MSIRCNLVIALIVCLHVHGATVWAYPSGAPKGACKEAKPHHKQFQPQPNPSPFTVVAEHSGAYVTVTIEDAKTHTKFKGFLLQAFYSDNGERMDTGVFVPSDISKGLQCSPGINNSLTHNSKAEKSDVKAIWIPSNGIDRDILFRATVVEKFDSYWTGITSNSIRVKTTGEPPTSTTAMPSSTPASNDIYTGCGKSKGCFGFPNSGCVQERTCEMVLSYVDNPSRAVVDFELVGTLGSKTEGWFAMGLSIDDKMGDDSVTECVLYNGKVLLYESWNYKTNSGRGNFRLQGSLNITTGSLEYSNGIVNCKWTRPWRTVANGVPFDMDEQRFYLLLAKGELDKDGNKKYHHADAQVSTRKVDLFNVSIITGNNKPTTFVKVHGSLMTVAWIGFVSIAILLARHYKDVWPKYELLGTKIWFTIHRGSMLLGLACAIAGFVIIYVDVQAWSSIGANPHPILGVIVMALMVLQPFIAILRPAPTSPKRPIFRWIHGLIGHGAQLLACINMFFAVKISRSNLPQAFYYVLATFIAFHCLTHLLIHIHTYLMEIEREREGRSAKTKPNFQQGDGSQVEQGGPESRSSSEILLKSEAEKTGSAFKQFVLGLYTLVVIGLTASLVLMICLN